MGLSFSVDAKALQRSGSERIRVGSCSMNGKRAEMEDAHKHVLSMPRHPNHAFFGIFDGHLGRDVAAWCASHVVEYVDSLPEFTTEALVEACLKADRDLRPLFRQGGGCAAIFTIAEYIENAPNPKKPWKLIVCNIGDSRCMLGRDGKTLEALSFDHKPKNKEEYDRIRRAGGTVAVNRVDGNLALSRAFGDFEYKDNPSLPEDEQKVIAVPDVITVDNVGSDDFLLLCCDGLVERLENEDLVKFVSQELQQTDDLAAIAGRLCDFANEKGSGDNLSAIIIKFEDGLNYIRPDEFIPVPQDLFERARHLQRWLRAYQNFVTNYTSLDWDDVLSTHEKREAENMKEVEKIHRHIEESQSPSVVKSAVPASPEIVAADNGKVDDDKIEVESSSPIENHSNHEEDASNQKTSMEHKRAHDTIDEEQLDM